MEAWYDVQGAFRDVWNTRLSEVDGQVLTIGTLLLALFIFIVGFIVLRWVTSLIDRRLLSRFEIQPTLRFSLKTFLFYGLLFFLLLFTFQMLSIPLTAFTVAGGALAIGIGFGSQTVMSNFISGLIVMIEKPIRIGDFIELEELTGRVERIGARSTLVRSSEDTWYVVPNSFFLEKSFLNWTLSDDIVRAMVSIRVAHRSDPARIRDLLMQAVTSTEGILDVRQPQVIFEDVAEDSLRFDVYFWIHAATPMRLRAHQSNVRFRIFEIFQKENIQFPYPQSDVHFWPERALEVRVSRGKRDSEPSPRPL